MIQFKPTRPTPPTFPVLRSAPTSEELHRQWVRYTVILLAIAIPALAAHALLVDLLVQHKSDSLFHLLVVAILIFDCSFFPSAGYDLFPEVFKRELDAEGLKSIEDTLTGHPYAGYQTPESLAEFKRYQRQVAAMGRAFTLTDLTILRRYCEAVATASAKMQTYAQNLIRFESLYGDPAKPFQHSKDQEGSADKMRRAISGAIASYSAEADEDARLWANNSAAFAVAILQRAVKMNAAELQDFIRGVAPTIAEEGPNSIAVCAALLNSTLTAE